MDDHLAKIILDTGVHANTTSIEIRARWQVHIPELTPELILNALRRIEGDPCPNSYDLVFYRLKTGNYPDSILQSQFLRNIQYTIDQFLTPWDPDEWQDRFDKNDDFCLTKAIYGLDFLKEEFNKRALEDNS